MSVTDNIGREIQHGDYVGQLNVSDQAKGASPINAGRIAKVVEIPASARTRVVVQFATDDQTRTIAGEHLMVMRYLNGEWSSDFDPARELSVSERAAMDAADRFHERYGNAIADALPTWNPAPAGTGAAPTRPRSTNREVRPSADDIYHRAPMDTSGRAVLHIGDVAVVLDPSTPASRKEAVATLARIQREAHLLEASLHIVRVAPEGASAASRG